MGRNIVLITTDQQRHDAYGVNGGTVARTPAADRLAQQAINYSRAYAANTVCMPTRSTILTGQHPRTHGVFNNGVPLDADAPSVARELSDRAGYRTALIGKAHWEPVMDPTRRWEESRLAPSNGPYRGFDHVELAMHSWTGRTHYCHWLDGNHADARSGFWVHEAAARNIPEIGDGDPVFGGETNAPMVKYNPMRRDQYHTDWIAHRANEYLDTIGDDDFFLWISFPDPHWPFDAPAEEVRRRINWRDIELPASFPGSHEKAARILQDKPRHWLSFLTRDRDHTEGDGPIPLPGPDQLREILSIIHVKNELLDEAIGSILDRLVANGIDTDTDVFLTTDHGDFQGDYHLLLKGPFHVDSLLRLPFMWRPAPSTGIPAARIDDLVGQVDLAPTFLQIAGVDQPEWMQGRPLPTSAGGSDDAGTNDHLIATWDSQRPDTGIVMQSIIRDRWLCTTYDPGPLYDGTEGELYDLEDDPFQWRNLWDDPSQAAQRSDLVDQLRENLPARRAPWPSVEAVA